MADSDNAALGPNGQLLDASKIAWYNDPDDAQPIQPTVLTEPVPPPPTPSVQEGAIFKFVYVWPTKYVLSGRSCPHRAAAGARLAEAIAVEKLDEFGKPTHAQCTIQLRSSAKRK